MFWPGKIWVVISSADEPEKLGYCLVVNDFKPVGVRLSTGDAGLAMPAMEIILLAIKKLELIRCVNLEMCKMDSWAF